MPTSSAESAFYLEYRPPYRFEELLSFFASRALLGVEKVDVGSYSRTVRLQADGADVFGWLCVSDDPKRNRLVLQMSDSLLPVASQVVGRVRRQFDVDCDPQAVYEGIASMDDVVPGAAVLGTRLPGCFEPFETACRAVLGQQVTVAAANKLAGRIVAAFGTPCDTGIDGLTHTFPTPAEITAIPDIESAFGEQGCIKSRSRTIASIAQLLVDGSLSFDAGAVVAQQYENLLAIKGIGPWSAGYIAMRCFGWTDAFLETDAGIKHALPEYEPKQRLELAEAWRPWRSYANICLWNSLKE